MSITTNPPAFPFIHWRTISFGDTDAAAIVYTPRFTDYCMQAMEVWFKEYIGVDWYRINVCEQRGTPVVHLEMDFYGPAIAGDQLGVRVLVNEVGRSTLIMDLEGRKKAAMGETQQQKIFSAKYIFCFVDTEKNRSIAIPSETLARVDRYLRECELAQLK